MSERQDRPSPLPPCPPALSHPTSITCYANVEQKAKLASSRGLKHPSNWSRKPVTKEEILPAQGHPQAQGGLGGPEGTAQGLAQNTQCLSPWTGCLAQPAPARSLGRLPCALPGLRLPGIAGISAPSFSDASPVEAGQLPTATALSLRPQLSWFLPMAMPPSPHPLGPWLTSGSVLFPTPWIPLVLASCISLTHPLASIPMAKTLVAPASLSSLPPGWPPCCPCLTAA